VKDLPLPSHPMFLQRVREMLRTLAGHTDNVAERAVTAAEVQALTGGTSTTIVVNGGGAAEEPDLTPPPTPTGFTLTPGLNVLFFDQDEQAYAQGHGHARTVVYGAKRASLLDPLPTFADAVELIQYPGVVYSLPVGLNEHWHIWAKWLSNDGVLSAAPSGGANGFQASTGLIATAHLQDDLVTAQKIAAGAVDALDKFLPGWEPISVVAALPNPAGYTGPKTVFLSTDQKLYRHTGAAWTRAIPTADLTGQITTPQITDSAITTAKVAAGAITAAEIAAGNVNANHIVAGAITGDKIAAGAVVADKIFAGAVTTDKIAVGAVIAGKIAAGAIVAGDGVIANAAIGSAQIGVGQILTANIGDGNITTAKIADLAVTTAKINDANITTAKIATAAITTALINDAAITTAKIADASIVNAKIGNAAVQTTNIADATITGAKIVNGEITNAKIANASVDAAKIIDGEINNAKITNGAITTAKIADASITTAKIVDANITTAKIGDLQVSTLKIQDNAVTVPLSVRSTGQSIVPNVFQSIAVTGSSAFTTGQKVLCIGTFILGTPHQGNADEAFVVRVRAARTDGLDSVNGSSDQVLVAGLNFISPAYVVEFTIPSDGVWQFVLQALSTTYNSANVTGQLVALGTRK
jgi:uncharacterized protein YjbI with pentapeptide repeats